MMTFFHSGDASMASYRYRAAIPAQELGVKVNDETAPVWVFAKPHPSDVEKLRWGKAHGKTVIVDLCDLHFNRSHYHTMIREADYVTACSRFLAQIVEEDFERPVTVIDDPYEFPERAPHVTSAGRLLWFGHRTNWASMQRWMWAFPNVVLMGDGEDMLPWSVPALQDELSRADIVLMPETAPHKSANRTLEAIRQGCFVVAEPHPSINELPGIHIGDLRKGVEWAISNPAEANVQVKRSQNFIRSKYAPSTQANAWRSLLSMVKSASTLAAANGTGLAGPTLTKTLEPTCRPTFAPCPTPMASLTVSPPSTF